MKLAAFIIAALFFVLAGFNFQFTTGADNRQSSIRWEWFGAAALTVALWVL